MIYKIILAHEEFIDFTFFEVDIPKVERYNIADALFCEVEYDDFKIWF